MEYTWTHIRNAYSLYLYVHICTHVYICMCGIYVCAYMYVCVYGYIKHIHTVGICFFFFYFSNLEENETSCGNKLVQNMLELLVFTCTKSLLLVRRTVVFRTASSFVWTPWHMHLESWNKLFLGRIVQWLVDKAISCLLEAFVISVPILTLSLRKDGFMIRARSMVRLPGVKSSLYHLGKLQALVSLSTKWKSVVVFTS